MVSYIIYLKNGTRIECKPNDVWKSFVSVKKKADICSIHKLYRYEMDMNINLYAYEFPNADCLDYYMAYPLFYGPNAIEDIDIQLVTYLHKLPRDKSGHML